MNKLKLSAMLALGAAVSACTSIPDVASRNAPFERTSAPVAAPQLAFQQTGDVTQQGWVSPYDMQVSQINVRVPRQLTVSEENKYYPRADIVWRGETIGDRRAQIKSIFETAFTHGTKDMQGNTPVALDVELVRFHSLSEKARYTVGGVHNMVFNLTVIDANTGAVVVPTREVIADLPAFGGNEAIEAERRGQTQKVRVTGYLSYVIGEELRKTPADLAEVKPVRKGTTNF